MVRKILVCAIFFVLNVVSAQDTICFRQEASVMFTSQYLLYPATKKFEHEYRDDNGGRWYGKGSYEIKGRHIYFHFKDAQKESLKINLYRDSLNLSETLKIRFLDTNFETIWPSKIQVGNQNFDSGFGGIIEIPKEIITSSGNTFTFLNNSKKESIHLENIDDLKQINILGCIFFTTIHYESNFTRKLKFRNNKIISKDYYGGSDKNVRFVSQK